jgi:2-amino-4-hydroxy-6-hydroxymethyldihydropteridine diphosphokinase
MTTIEYDPIGADEPIVLLTGSNEGRSHQILFDARLKLAELLNSDPLTSSLYQSPPWGFMAENDFLNQALIFYTQTNIQPLDLLRALLDIERAFGRERKRETGYQSRTLDIDIILIGDRIIRHPSLTVPHPKLQERRFVLAPICELNPTIKHPVFGNSFSDLLQECEDPSDVKRI